jgi:transposase InsO family protein
MIDPDGILKKGPLPDAERRLLEAAWRFQVVALLLDTSIPGDERRRIREKLLEGPLDHPWRGKIKVSARSLRRWCQNYRERGLAALKLQARKDAGRIVRLPKGALDRALALREEDGRRSVPQLIRLMLVEKPEWKDQLRRSTLDRHLRARGSRRHREGPKAPFIAFEAKNSMDLWQLDTLVGPMVRLDEARTVRSRIVGILDDSSRFLCHLEAYPDEKVAVIEDALRKSILKHGRPLRIFCDNAQTFSGTAFTLACSQLGIAKIHSTPHYPASRGKIERAFRTLRDQLLGEIENLPALSLEQMNRYLVAWAQRYHQTVHSQTKQSPEERFKDHLFRPVAPDMLEEAFWLWESRTVSPRGEIKLFGNLYWADPTLAGSKIVIRYDPGDLSRIHLWKDNRKLATATPKELLYGSRRGTPTKEHTQQSEAAQRYLDDLERAMRRRLEQELNLTDYREMKEGNDD